MCCHVQFDDGAEVAKRDDQTSIKIEVDGIWVIDRWIRCRGIDLVSVRPVVPALHHGIHSPCCANTQNLMTGDLIGCPAAICGFIDCANVISEKEIGYATAVRVALHL